MIDLLIKNGRTVDGEQIELAIHAGKIIEVGPQLAGYEAEKTLTLDDTDRISAGWIDDHVHCFEKMDLYYDYPDKVGVETGVTSVVDAGTTGASNIGTFYELAQAAKTNVYALLNISKWGIVEQDELADLTKIDPALIDEAIARYPDFIVGLKARMSNTVIGDNGITPLRMAKAIQQSHPNLPLMVHIGSAPPLLDEILDQLTAGDIVTHIFNGKENGILDQQALVIKDFIEPAHQKGLLFDVGHGTASFNFTVAEAALREGMVADMISTDIYSRNRIDGPVYDFATTLEKMHVVGYSWTEIIEKVTEAPAQAFGLTTKGKLAADYDADLTIFKIEAGEKTLTDSNGNQRLATETIRPLTTIIGGTIYDINL